jgi:hypothetical protein
MVGAIEAPGLAFNLGFEEGLGVDPHTGFLAAFQGELKLVVVTILHLFDSVQINFGALRGVIDQRTIEVRLRGCHFHFFRGVGFNLPPIWERRLSLFTLPLLRKTG